MNISGHISELLLKNDCIVLEGFGGFILQKNNAVRTERNLFAPPSKSIAFNAYLKSNDGILLNHLILEEQLSQEEASANISHYINQLRNTLEKEKLVVLPSIGKFYYDADKKLRFTPDHTKNFDSKTFGLGPVSVNPIVREKKDKKTNLTDQAPAIKVNNSKAKSDVKKKRKISLVPVLKVAAVVALVSGIVYQFIDQKLEINDFSKENMASIEISGVWDSMLDLVPSFEFSSDEKVEASLPENESPAKVYKKAPIQKELELKAVPIVEETSKKKPIYKKASADQVKAEEKKQVKVATKTEKQSSLLVKTKKLSKNRKPIFLNEDNYNSVYVIVGAFGAEKNAQKMIKMLSKDKIQAKVLSNGAGLFRVGVYGFSSYEDAEDTWILVKKSYAPSAWVLGQDEV